MEGRLSIEKSRFEKARDVFGAKLNGFTSEVQMWLDDDGIMDGVFAPFTFTSELISKVRGQIDYKYEVCRALDELSRNGVGISFNIDSGLNTIDPKVTLDQAFAEQGIWREFVYD